MTTLATAAFNLNKLDNQTLTHANLMRLCVERNNNWQDEKTMWIFNDGSALLESSNSEFEVFPNYARHVDHEQLTTYIVYELYNSQERAIMQTTSMERARKTLRDCERYQANTDYTYHITEQ